MVKVLVFQHVAWEILGTLNPLLKRHGARIRYVNFGRHPDVNPCLDGYRGLVVLGGPMSAYDREGHPHLETEVDLIRTALDRELPVLGICLGAQLLARALGARVYRAPSREIGWYDVSLTEAARRDPLFEHFGGTERLFQWHGDTFELPRGAVRLAASEVCPQQAFRFGERAYGLQFHLEVDEPLIARWLRVPEHRAEMEALHGAVDPEHVMRETAREIARLKQLGDLTFGAFARLLGAPERKAAHPHR